VGLPHDAKLAKERDAEIAIEHLGADERRISFVRKN